MVTRVTRPGDADWRSRRFERNRPLRTTSQEQLVKEVKGIYAGLVMVENKCIEVDSAQQTQQDTQDPKLSNEQWQALIALHRTLLHEHHDFFLGSQHPSTSPTLRRLASKYAMPARMWRHGIHSFLEYRMAIEDDDIRDRKVWTAVCRGWYGKASDMAPTIGRLYHHLLYHHLAILALPDPLQQLYCYPNRVEPCLAYSELLLTTPILPEEDYAMGSFAWTERYLAESSVFDANCDETVFSLVVPVRIGAPMHCFSKRVVHRSGFGSLARILRSSAFHKLIRAWIPFALLSLAHARLDPWRTHKVIGMGVSAVSTLGTSLASMQVDHVAGEEGKMAKMTLRIICSVSLMILAGGYITCFLHNGRKARPFLKGFFSVALACVIFVGLFLGSSTAAPTDEFAILDRINVTGLMSVLAGIFNAESRLFESFCGEQGSANDGDHDDDGDDNDVAFQESRIGLTRSTSSFGRTQSGIHRESYASPYQNQPGSSFSAGGL
ncbi:hypothetical protein QBC47DRAFT_360172 [Echria macrotheca]|uniref:Uncharacterized protein n=1 Tax=Echria macrotheca TaxID=438768 RepID=A0AAJ0BIJ3_9PEZI|nr:hypothetical protein QBC47DRAFT_360172 [Echria macrotheca]